TETPESHSCVQIAVDARGLSIETPPVGKKRLIFIHSSAACLCPRRNTYGLTRLGYPSARGGLLRQGKTERPSYAAKKEVLTNILLHWHHLPFTATIHTGD